MHKSNKFAHTHILQLNFDVFFLIVTYVLAYFISCQLIAMETILKYLWMLIIFVPVWVSIMAFLGMYDRTTFYYWDRILRSVILASSFSGFSLGTMFFFIRETSASHLLVEIFFLLCLIIMFLARTIFSLVLQRCNVNSAIPRIVVVCSQQTLFLFRRYLRKTHIRFNIIDTILFDERDASETRQPELNGLEDLGKILKSRVVDEVVLAIPGNYSRITPYIHLCEQLGITVHLVLHLSEPQISHVRISMLGPLPVLTFNTVTLNPFQKTAKRTMDIAGALIGILITTISAIFIVPAIKLDSPGPVIFKQKRVGRNGRVFNLYKFRTMCVDAEAKKEELHARNQYKNGLMFKIKEDPRITQVGSFLRKTSLDELPQFFNVLRGDMSLVGTRPPTLEEFSQYELEHIRRMSIKPGVTGAWQVSGRSAVTDFDEVVALDVWYIDNWSIWLDICILLKTVGQITKMDAAY